MGMVVGDTILLVSLSKNVFLLIVIMHCIDYRYCHTGNYWYIDIQVHIFSWFFNSNYLTF